MAVVTSQVEQTLLNLCTNAVHAIGSRHGHIQVEVPTDLSLKARELLTELQETLEAGSKAG